MAPPCVRPGRNPRGLWLTTPRRRGRARKKRCRSSHSLRSHLRVCASAWRPARSCFFWGGVVCGVQSKCGRNQETVKYIVTWPVNFSFDSQTAIMVNTTVKTLTTRDAIATWFTQFARQNLRQSTICRSKDCMPLLSPSRCLENYSRSAPQRRYPRQVLPAGEALGRCCPRHGPSPRSR